VPAIQAVPAPPLPEPPFGAGDVYVSLSCIAAAGQQLLDDLNEKLSVTMLAVDAHDSAADIVQRALVVASQGGAGFEERLQHLYTSLLQVGDLCIDIGAHTGRHSLPMSRVVGTTGRVVAFEPNPAIAQRLRARLKLLSVGNVAVRETALSDEEGTAGFVIAVDLPEESGLRQRTIYNGPTRTETVTVQLARLDGLHLESPRFIKLDTEGAEYKVLVGARDTLARWRPVVAFEFGQASYAAYDVDPDDMFDYFASLDYEVFSILGDRLTKPQFAEASRVQRYWDYVACDRGASARIAAILQGFG
jgi:FkbM family methyltransferase